MKLSQGAKSSEFWPVAALIVDWFLQRFGVYEHFSPDQIMSTAEQVGQIASQLRGETGSDSGLIYLLAGAYVAGRSAVKWKQAHPARYGNAPAQFGALNVTD